MIPEFILTHFIAQTPLYNGAEITILQSIVHHLSWFSEHPSISKQALSDLLKREHHYVLPPGNHLPDSYEAAMKLAKDFLIEPIVFHACPNDCVLFRGEYVGLSVCPKCGAERYSAGSVAARRFTYLPIGPRIARMFGTSNLSQIVQTHSNSSESNFKSDIHDSIVWEKAYSKDGVFCGDTRGVSLAVCTDGVNPFSKNRVSYSMWPIFLTILNLPRHVRNLFSNILLVGIIPGKGSKEASNIQPYLEVLVDEILSLSNQVIFDAYHEAPFKLKVEVLLYVLDYPGVCKVFNTLGSGSYNGCMWCEIKGK